MRTFFQKIRNRDKDYGGATLVTGVLSIMFLCLCMGFAMDIAKNAYLRSTYTAMAQNAATAAVQSVDENGGLTPDSANLLVNEYMKQRFSNYTNPNVAGGSHSDETNSFRSDVCSTRNVTTWKGTTIPAQMPYMEIRYDTARGGGAGSSVVQTSQGGAAPVVAEGTWNSSRKYTVISVKIFDSSTNLMLNMFGIPCQNYTLQTNAITFASDSDVS